jgi:lysine/ornithine N-monooxygenase
VESDQSQLVSQRVVLALGRHTPVYPAWAEDLKVASAYHVFDPAFCLDHLPQGGHVAVIGGGISAAQTALRVAQEAAHVHLITRHRLRVRDFDSAPSWMGPRYLDSFKKKDLVRRRELIRRARNVGSVPSDVLNALDRAIRQRRLTLHRDEVSIAFPQEGGRVALHLVAHGALKVEALIYATGLETKHIEGAWLQTACAQEGLPLAPCGFPILTPRLAWAVGLYVMGHLAELEIGPVAPNIIGARMAAERIGREAS